MNKIIYNKDYLNSYCSENNIVLTKLYNNTNRDTKIEGKCLTENCLYDYDLVFSSDLCMIIYTYYLLFTIFQKKHET
jgi:hypothetical protein